MNSITLPRILIAVGITALIILAYHCGSQKGEVSMRQYKKEQTRKEDSLRGQNKIQENIIRSQAVIINQSQIREQQLQSEKKAVEERLTLQRSKDAREREKLLRGLENASDKELAETMVEDYKKEAGAITTPADNSARLPQGVSPEAESIKGNQLILTGQVIIPSQVAAWHIYERRFKQHLLAENRTLDSLLVLWEKQGQEFEVQRNAFKVQLDAKDTLISQKEQEIKLFKDGQDFMEGKARKFRRQRNGIIAFGVASIGAITYLVLK